MQRICFAPHLEKYQDFETNPAMVTLETVKWQIQNGNFYKILFNDLWVGSLNIRKLDNSGNYKLHIINVLPEYQSMVGQSAIKQSEEIFADAKTWCLETIEDMLNNRHVYEKMGYLFMDQTEKANDKLTLVFYKKTVGA